MLLSFVSQSHHSGEVGSTFCILIKGTLDIYVPIARKMTFKPYELCKFVMEDWD